LRTFYHIYQKQYVKRFTIYGRNHILCRLN